MRPHEAIEMLTASRVGELGPTTWADLGCGDGTFTRALAALLEEGSVIHAMDRDTAALRHIPSSHDGVRIHTHHGDFIEDLWPFTALDGILMANALHYVRDQAAFIRACETRMNTPRRFLIVEYDSDAANRWVPFPVSSDKLKRLFEAAGYHDVQVLHTRPSRYRSSPLYSALIVS